MITSSGIGSGLDVESIITQLMAIEREPLNNLALKQADLDIKISALGTIRSAVSELETAADDIGDTDKFGAFQAMSFDEDVFTVETAPGTNVENHAITVNSLAVAHQLASDPYPGGGDSSITQQTYSFSSGDESFDIVIDGTNDTLTGLRDAINDAADNTSISASVINLSDGSRLILSAKNTGTDAAITADTGLFSEITAAADASLVIDGFAATSQGNTVTDIIPGITLNLIAPGTTKLETTRNNDSYGELLSEFVSKYNTLVDSIDSLSEGDLSSDGTLRNMKSDLSRIFFEPIDINGTETSPFRLGMTFDQNGNLNINQTVLNEVSIDDTKNFIQAMTDPDSGFSTRVNEVLARYSEADGLLSDKQDSFEARMDSLDGQSERFEYRLEQTEARLRRQFTALDTLVSKLQATSSYLTDQLSNINLNGSSDS
ncbi:MAG: flagellar filament capping protein FliD [Granulosicoccus sp.]|nr:flagellar filament capping protein FliD [Granulosicoccus sp.]